MKFNRKIFTLLIILSALFLVAGIVSSAEPVKLGILSPVSGPYAFGGTEVRRGAEMAILEKGTLFGHSIEIEYADAPTPEAARTEVLRLIHQKNIKVIIGTYGSSIDDVASQVANEHNVLYYSLVDWKPGLTERGLDYYYRWAPSTIPYGKAVANHAVEIAENHLKKPKENLRIGLLNNTAVPYVMDPVEETLLGLGVNPIFREEYDLNIKDMSSIIMKARQAKLDILILAQLTSDGILFRRQMKQIKYAPPIVIGCGMIHDQPEFGKILGKAADGVLSVSYTNPAMNTNIAPGLKEFKENFQRKYDEKPLTHALQSYAGTSVLLDAIEQAGTLEPNLIKKVLDSLDIPAGNTSAYWGAKFNEKHQNIRTGEPFVIGQWQDEGIYYVVGPGGFAVKDLKEPMN